MKVEESGMGAVVASEMRRTQVLHNAISQGVKELTGGGRGEGTNANLDS